MSSLWLAETIGPNWNMKVVEANRHHLHPDGPYFADPPLLVRGGRRRPSTKPSTTSSSAVRILSTVTSRANGRYPPILELEDGQRHVGIAFDEWGVWHPEATKWNGFEAPSTMSDAVTAAGVFDVFHRWSNRLSMGNIAQIVNVLQALVQTKGESMWLTPTYHAVCLVRRPPSSSCATAVRTGEIESAI